MSPKAAKKGRLGAVLAAVLGLLLAASSPLEALRLYPKNRVWGVSENFPEHASGETAASPETATGYLLFWRVTCVGSYRDVEYYDGRGRRETFEVDNPDEGSYTSPAGRFVVLTKTAAGWVWIGSHKDQMRFDRYGRLVAVADAVRDSDGSGGTTPTGNEMRFAYDPAGRLVQITDRALGATDHRQGAWCNAKKVPPAFRGDLFWSRQK